MRKTVFISSTYEDLKLHRAKIWDALNKFDVNIRGMEQFGARKETPLNTCLSEVEQSDIYIGIISMRLGSVDPSTEKSYTQLEYEKALDLSKEILIYIFDESNGTIKTNFVDFGEKHDKLEAFKSILKERHTIDTFTDENDICEKLKRRFDELLSKKEVDNVDEIDEYSKSKEIIGKFIILPKLYSGREIKLNVKFRDNAFPASKSICEKFGFSYGQTFGIKVTYIQPKIDSDFPELLFVDHKFAEKFFSIMNSENVEIYAKLLFSEESASSVEANFIRKTYYSTPFFNLCTDNLIKKTVIEAEGEIIILLTKII